MATFTEDVIARGGMGGLGGDGLGGGLLLGLLLGRGGLLGNNGNDGGCVTPEMLNQQTLGDIKAAIPYNEAQVQLALAQAVASLSTQGTADTQYLSGQNQNAALAAANANALIARDIAGVDTNVDRQSTAIQIAIANDGAKTRDLITSNQIAELNQRLTVAQLENAENRSIQREMTNSHNVTTIVNTNQQQQQLQNQEIRFALNSLIGGFGQLAKATNSNVVVGSAGVGTSQTANPTNVNA
jgi:hypothetical protein